MLCRCESWGTFRSAATWWVYQVPVDVPVEVEIQRQVQVPVPVMRQVPAPFPEGSSVLVWSHRSRDGGGT